MFSFIVDYFEDKSEMLESKKISDEHNVNIIAVFLDDKFNIIEVKKKEKEEWNNNIDLEESVRDIIVNSKNYAAPAGIQKIQQNSFGGVTPGINSISPIHIKMNLNLLNQLKDNNLSRITGFVKGIKNDSKKVFKKTKISFDFIIDFFKDLETYEKEFNFQLTERDYVVFVPRQDTLSEIINLYNERKNLIKFSSESYKVNAFCSICGKKMSKGNVLSELMIKNMDEKHRVLTHKFYLNNKYPNALVCDSCNIIITKFFGRLREENIKETIIPIDVYDDEGKEIVFSKEKIFEKLMKISETKNPFDYVLILSQKTSISFDFIPSYDAYIKTNINLLSTSSPIRIWRFKDNEIIKEKDLFDNEIPKEYRIIDNDKIKRTVLYKHLNFILNNLNIYLLTYLENKKVINNKPTTIRILFYRYRESMIDVLYRNKIHILEFMIKDIITTILSNIHKENKLLDIYKTKNGKYKWYIRKLIAISYLYGGDDIKNEIEILNNIHDMKNKLDNDANMDLNNIEASYILGQLFYFILTKSNSNKDVLELLKIQLIGVNSIEDLVKKLLNINERYSHNIYSKGLYSNTMSAVLNKVLKDKEFSNKSFKEYIIPFYFGFFHHENMFFNKKDGGATND